MNIRLLKLTETRPFKLGNATSLGMLFYSGYKNDVKNVVLVGSGRSNGQDK